MVQSVLPLVLSSLSLCLSLLVVVTETNMQLWESKSKPKLYYTGVKYHKKARARAFTHRPSETPGSLNRELKIFCMTFLRKTGVDWNDRLEKAKTSNGIVTGVGGGKHGGYRYEMPVSRVVLDLRLRRANTNFALPDPGQAYWPC